MRIQEIPVEELIDRINDNIDTFHNPHSRIESVNNSDHWDRLGEYLGGWELMQMIRGGVPAGARWMQYDEEMDTIYFFSSKKAILDTIGVETIQSYYEEGIVEI